LIITILVVVSSAAILTVSAAETLFGNLPLVNSSGSSYCLGWQTPSDGTWDIQFDIRRGRDYVLDSVQFIWRLPAGKPPTTVSADFHLHSTDYMSAIRLARFNDVTVSSTGQQTYTLRPDRDIVMQGGRRYTVQIWTDEAGGSCSLALPASDTPPTGDFTYVDNIGPQMFRFIGFQLDGTPLGAGSGDEPIIDEDGNVIVYSPDDRVNWQCGDDVAVIFKVNDSENNPALHVYQPDTEGVNPHRPLVITRADLPKPMPPAENTWIAEEGLVNVYVLTTGEIQFNIGPTWDGKVRVVIFPDTAGEIPS